MSVRTSLYACLIVALVAPAVASASDGVIRFAGAIVEPAVCMPRVTPAIAGGLPRVVCATESRIRAADPALRVKTSVREMPAATAEDRAAGKHYLVTLEYL
ncbi:hypothetical protein LMG26690_00673 [Achromobacter animicus]|uniref:Type 1 fimbrial protein n=1 Tax=Achromobacter animicus TaxID=1389935 RepID=A0A6S6Z5J1_9BURK|nr:hypothetical protein [Achromobacter animicus]CAB3662954.1 hypothetical protein LMG26690_00673 [Achromobacter animicus]